MNAIFSSFIVMILILGCARDKDESGRLQRGNFKATITESGELQAVSSRIINMPDFSWEYGKIKIIDLETEGTVIKKGAYIAQIDTSSVARKLVQTQSDLAIAEADYQKLLIEHVSALRQLDSELNSAQAALKLSEIDTLSVQFETIAKKEQSHIEHEKCRLEISKLKVKILYREQIQKEEKFILAKKIENHKRAIRDAQNTIDRFTLHAPADGMIEYRSRGRPRRKISIGDEFYRGEPIIGLPDLSKMRATTTVNERDIKKLELGQSANVRLDAFPQRTFHGVVTSISKMCHREEDDSQIKVFDVEILLDETDIILKPGMTISCEIFVAELEDVFYVQSSHIYEEVDGYCIYVSRDGDRMRIPVKLGPRNPKQVVIYGDLEVSDILLNAPEQEES